jgi:hypothetical protein
MIADEAYDEFEDLCVEAFLAPLAEVGPASRINGRRRARRRFRRTIVLVLVLLGLAAGAAVAAEDENTLTVVDTNGHTTTATLIPVPPPGAPDACADPACVLPGEDGPVSGPHKQAQRQR